MPIVLAILGFCVVVWVVTVAVWLLQWIAAAIVWFFQAFLLPIFMFLLPAVIAIVVLVGIYWGGWVATKNYFLSVRKNINPEGALKLFVRRSVVATQTLTLGVLCSAATVISGILIYSLGAQGVDYIHGYYAAIKYPHYTILYPFWKHF